MEHSKGIIIGEQMWMAKNLSVTTFQNGDVIPQIISREEWETAGIEGKPAYCYYNNNAENKVDFGILYNWFAITDPRGLAPIGWRIPVKADWERLIKYLGGADKAGEKMKSTNGWLQVDPTKNGNGSNESGFNAFPSGTRNFIGDFHNKGLSCAWWCLNSSNIENDLFYFIVSERNTIDNGIFDVEEGLSVRCIKI